MTEEQRRAMYRLIELCEAKHRIFGCPRRDDMAILRGDSIDFEERRKVEGAAQR